MRSPKPEKPRIITDSLMPEASSEGEPNLESCKLGQAPSQLSIFLE